MSLRNLEFRFLSKTGVLKHCCVVPNAPEGIKFHTVSCAILSLHVKVKLPLSFLRFLCLWQGLTLLFAPCSSRAPQDDPHAQKPQTGQSPAHPQHTVSSPHDWTHINTRSRSDRKQKKQKSWQEYCFYLRQEAEFQILRLSFCKPKLSILIRWAFFQSQR